MPIKFEIPSTIDTLKAETFNVDNIVATSDINASNITITNSFVLDGYQIDLSSGASPGQILEYNGTKFIAANNSGGGNAIGDSISGSTSKSILYINASNQLAQDASNLVWDYSTNFLGIGTSNPIYRLDVRNNSAASVIHFRGSSSDDGGYLISSSSSQAIISGGMSYNGSNFIAKATTAGALDISGGNFNFYNGTGLTIGNTLTPTSVMYIATTGNIDIGSSGADPGIKLNIAANTSTAGIALGNGSSLALSAANTGRIRYNSGTQHFEISENGSAYTQLNAGGGGTISGTLNAGFIPYASNSSTIADTNLTWSNVDGFLGVGQAAPIASLDVLQANKTSGNPIALKVSGGSHTTLPASTEVNDIKFALNRTVQLNTGAIGTQRAVLISAPTYSFVGASTITNAATLAISGAPIQGTNATITNPYSIWAQSGIAAFDEHIKVDGYTIDLSSGASINQVLQYDGTKFIAATISGGSMSIGGAITSATSGSVLFVNSSSQLAQNNANFFWDATNTRLGINTNAPGTSLEVRSSSASLGTMYLRNTNASGVSQLELYNNSGTFKIAFGASNTGGDTYLYTGSSTDFSIQLNNGAQKHIFKSGGTVGLGSATPNTSNRLEVSGSMTVGTYTNTVAPTNGLIVSGSVGIGTSAFTNSSINLEVRNANGNAVGGQFAMRNTNSTGQTELDVYDSSANFRMSFGFDNNSIATTPNAFVYTGTSTNFRIYVNNAATTHVFTSSGGLGLNTTTVNASNRLEVNGAVAIGSGYSNTVAPSNGLIVQGIVGIGTSSPGSTYALFVQGTASADGIATYKNTSASGYSNIRYEKSDGTFQGSIGFANASAGITHLQNKMHFFSGGPNYVIANNTAVELEFGATNTQAFIEWNSGSSAAVSASNRGRIRYNTSTQHFEISENGGGYAQISTGTGAIGGSIAANQVAYGSGTNAIQGSSGLTYNGTTFTVAQHISVDGYLIDISSGATTNQVLQYNGTKFVAATVSGGSSIGTTGEKFINIIPCGTRATGTSATPLVVHSMAFDPSIYTLTGTTKTLVFRVVAATGNSTVTGHVKLRDITTGQDISVINLTNQTTQIKSEISLTTGTPGTNVIANSEKIYEIRIYVDSPSLIDDTIELYSAEIRVINTVN